jgi:FkbM family methyltransferase
MNIIFNKIKRTRLRYFPESLRRIWDFFQWDNYFQKSWSQEGEDLILSRFFEQQPRGFYVDVGAHHPHRFSNTYKFYLKGWKGINIDATPGSMNLFNKLRKRDVNLEIPVSSKSQKMLFYIFNEPALNGFSKDISQERHKGNNKYHIVRTEYLITKTLSEILDEHLPGNSNIDFLSIDVEGLDFDVIKSNDWSKYRPRLVLVEILNSSISDLNQSKIAKYLFNQGYEFYAKTVNTVFFRNI